VYELVPSLHVRLPVQVPVDELLTPMLVVPQQGCPMPPQAVQVAVDDWEGQYALGAVQT
jgi:hypothetical protein